MEECVEIQNFRKIKYFEEELIDVFNYVSKYINAHTEKEIKNYYDSIICHKIDRLCLRIPNFIINSETFKMIKEIFLKIIELKEDPEKKNEQNDIINEMYFRFKYLLEWCILYYEETYLDN